MAITPTVAASLTTVTGAISVPTPVPRRALAVPISSSPTLTDGVACVARRQQDERRRGGEALEVVHRERAVGEGPATRTSGCHAGSGRDRRCAPYGIDRAGRAGRHRGAFRPPGARSRDSWLTPGSTSSATSDRPGPGDQADGVPPMRFEPAADDQRVALVATEVGRFTSEGSPPQGMSWSTPVGTMTMASVDQRGAHQEVVELLRDRRTATREKTHTTARTLRCRRAGSTRTASVRAAARRRSWRRDGATCTGER